MHYLDDPLPSVQGQPDTLHEESVGTQLILSGPISNHATIKMQGISEALTSFNMPLQSSTILPSSQPGHLDSFVDYTVPDLPDPGSTAQYDEDEQISRISDFLQA